MPTYSYSNESGQDMPIANDGTFSFQSFPLKEFTDPVVYEVLSPDGTVSTLSLNWVAALFDESKVTTFNSSDEYYQQFCQFSNSDDRNTNFRKHQGTNMNTVLSVENSSEDSVISNDINLQQITYPFTIFAKDSDGSFYLLDETTAVWLFTTFSPEKSAFSWLQSITASLKKIQDLGVPKLIIDVSNNYGGDIVFVTLLAKYLFPTENIIPISYDIRSNDALKQLFEANLVSYSTYSYYGLENALSSGYIDSAEGLFSPGFVYNRGGVNASFSNIFQISYENQKKAVETFFNTPEKFQLISGYKSENVAIVSNGICISSCANFVR